jgi:hypothetical protein
MLLSEVSSKNWKDEFQKKFVSFAKKSPVVLSLIIKIEKGEEGALITHVNSNTKYFFPFDYSVKPCDFIHNIKMMLVQSHYPRVVEEILEKHEFTKEELAKQLEGKGDLDNLNKYEMRVVGTRQFRIDKVLLWRNIFLLVLENSSFEDDEIGKIFRYKLNVSPVTFLRNYRSGKFKSLEEASAYFFGNAILIDSIKSNEDTERSA